MAAACAGAILVDSLYDLTVACITREFHTIDVNYLADLPKPILQDLVHKSNPVGLEKIEGTRILTLKGIVTIPLWKAHCLKRWKYINSDKIDAKAWRSIYFQRHFREAILRRVGRRMDRPNAAPESTQDMLDLCAKHLSQLRLCDAMCLYISKTSGISEVLAKHVVHLTLYEVSCRRGMKAFVNVIRSLVSNKLTSLTFDSCSIIDEEAFTQFLLALCNQTAEDKMILELSAEIDAPGSDACSEYQDDIMTQLHGSCSNPVNDGISCDVTEDDLYDDIFTPKRPKPDLAGGDLRCSSLTMLEVNEFGMGHECFVAFIKMLKHFTNLNTLTLKGFSSSYGPYDAEMIELISEIRALVVTSSLRHLEVHLHGITGDLMTIFRDMIMVYCHKCFTEKSSKGLRSLRLDNLDRALWSRCAQTYIASNLTICSTCKQHDGVTEGIRGLSLRNCVYNSRRTIAAITRNKSLKRLSLPSCTLPSEDIATLFDFISGCDEPGNAITTLKLADNPYLPLHDGSLSNLLKLSQLTYLDLSNCSIEVLPEDVISALSVNVILSTLKIAANLLGDNGAIAITRLFQTKEKKSALTSLDLSRNRISAAPLLALGQVLKSWPRKLTKISIHGNLLDGSEEQVKICLQEVFEHVLTRSFDTSATFFDYLSEM